MKKLLLKVSLVAVFLPIAWGDVQTAEAPPDRSAAVIPVRVTTRSASGRFVVFGPDSAGNSQYTRWAEEIVGRMERLLAEPLPPVGRTCIEIFRVYGMSVGPAMTVDCRPEGSTRRILTVNEFFTPDYERMQDSICALLLDGCVEERRRASGHGAAAFAVPAWFSMGVSQNLAVETRNRDRKVVTGWMPSSDRLGVASVFEWRALPEGWPRNWALCGMAVHWLVSLPGEANVFDLILNRLAEGGTARSEWVAARICRVDSVEGMEQAWRDWLSRQDRTIQEFGGLSAVLIEQLRAELDLVLPAVSEAGPGRRSPRRLTPAQVADESERSAALRLAVTEKIQRIRAITLGKAPELVEVGEAYGLFFAAILHDSWSPLVRWRLSRADAALNRLAKLTRAREAYLNEIEREIGSEGVLSGGSPESVEPVLEKSRIDAYLDDVEKRFTKPDGKKAD